MTKTRIGSTLVELLVTIVLLGIVASMTTLAARRFEPPRADDPAVIISAALDSVLASGRSQTLRITVGGESTLATVNPDGSVIADSILHLNRLTGRTIGDR